MTDRTDREALRGAPTLKALPASSDVAWNKAVRTPWVKLSAEERDAGWPDAFTPENLARLQHPYEGTDSEKKRARRDQGALLDGLRASIEAETLSVLERTRTEDLTEWRTVPNWNAPRKHWTPGFYGDDDRPPTVNQRVKIGERAVTFRAIGRAAFRDFLAAQGIEPSEHIRAWLRPLEQAEEAAPAKRKRETQADRVARCLTDCEDRAAAHGEPFDRKRMPGTKAEFLDLLHALDAELRSIETVDSLDRYLSKTGCKWPLNAGKQSSAAPLYARLFPEARIRAPGAVSPQRRKA